MSVQSSIRAYVSGESQWSKGQKDAVIHINRFYKSKLKSDFQLFLKSIEVPLGDRLARESLNLPSPDIVAARRGFLQGKNHVDDIDGLINLYLYFHDTELMKVPIEQWVKGDSIIAKIQKLANQLYSETYNNSQEADNIINEINALNLELTPVEQKFSNALGEVSRKVSAWILWFSIFFTVLLVSVGIYMSRKMVSYNLLATEKIKNSEFRFRALLASSMDAVIEINSDSIISHWSSQAEATFGYSEEEALGDKLHMLIIPPAYVEAHLMGMKRYLRTGDGPVLNKRIEVIAKRKSNEEFPAELVISAYSLNNSHMFCAYIRDITEQKKYAEKLRSIAHFDSVTALPNRFSFQDKLDETISICKQGNLPISVMFIDIDNFKDINDSLGHQVGDILLKEASKRMLKCLRKSDFLARFGGDEFALIVSKYESKEEVEEVAKRLIESVKLPFNINDELAYVSLSIGISSYPVGSTSYSELLKNADQAMYQVKRSGKNSYSHFNSAMNEIATLKRQLTNDIRSAIKEDQLELYYQPIVNIQNGEILKCEALIRWKHPQKGMIEPSLFIPIAEESGLIIEIGELVFQKALKSVLKWRQLINPKFQVSINVSPIQLNSGNKQQLFNQLSSSVFLSDAFIIEITEGVLVNANQTVSNTLLNYRDCGVQVALDDFGTGYSSLSYITKFDIDYIKIDKSFLIDLTEVSENFALCEAMIVMAHKLGIKVVAEGVETPSQLEILRKIDCDFAQGYLFSKPIPEAEMESFLNNNAI